MGILFNIVFGAPVSLIEHSGSKVRHAMANLASCPPIQFMSNEADWYRLAGQKDLNRVDNA